jgi:hypothetical protein
MGGTCRSVISRPDCTSRLTVLRAASLNVSRSGPGPIEAIGPGAHAIAERQSETILGESCAWYNVTPGMADGGLHQCWTDDGIVLKEKRYSRGSRETLEAVRLERRPIRDEEVTPPPDILDRRHFGLPE